MADPKPKAETVELLAPVRVYSVATGSTVDSLAFRFFSRRFSYLSITTVRTTIGHGPGAIPSGTHSVTARLIRILRGNTTHCEEKRDVYIRARRKCAALVVILLLPAAAFAQAAITGVVKDASGAVLPGVTVEAASSVLIEKVRSVVTDDTGQYRIVDLRPGTYVVTFTLPGFSTVKREGIELSGDFVATVNGDLRVGNLEETITVTGESPIVDVQSARVQTVVDKDVLTAIPSSRNATGIQSLVPGHEQQRRRRRHHRRQRRDGRLHPRCPRLRFRTLHDGINTGWAGANSNAAVSNVAGSQEVVMTTSGGLGEAETAGVMLNIIPARWRQSVQRHVRVLRAPTASMQGSNYTDELRTAGLRSPQELLKVWEVNPMGGGPIKRDKLWFYATYREVYAENTVPGMFFNKNAGDPTKWLVDFDTTRPAFVDS